jgi:hypothetical protein
MNLTEKSEEITDAISELIMLYTWSGSSDDRNPRISDAEQRLTLAINNLWQ